MKNGCETIKYCKTIFIAKGIVGGEEVYGVQVVAAVKDCNKLIVALLY
jgi:hypothetical protein